jgi:hypothetical protein
MMKALEGRGLEKGRPIMNIKGLTALAGGYGLMVKQEESYAEDSFIKDEELSL